MRKAIEARPLRLLVLHTVPSDSFAEDLMAEVVGAVKQQGQVEVANYDIPSLALYPCPGCEDDGSAAPCRVNDIDSKRYKSDDQFLAIVDSLHHADMVLISATVRAGGVNSDAQRLIERLECASKRRPVAFENKPLGIVVASPESDVWSIASRIAGYFNGYGMTIPPYGSIVITTAGRQEDDEATHDDESSSDVSSEVVNDILADRETQAAITRLARGLTLIAKGR